MSQLGMLSLLKNGNNLMGFPMTMHGSRGYLYQAGSPDISSLFAVSLAPANTMAATLAALPFTPDILIDKHRAATSPWSYRSTGIGSGKTVTSDSTSGTAIPTTWAGYSGSDNLVAYGLKKNSRFFNEVVFATDASGSATFSHGLDPSVTVGLAEFKSTTAVAPWRTYARGIGGSQYLLLNATAGQAAATNWFVATSTQVTVTGLAASATYVAHLYAHDTASDGVVQCGSFTTDASGNATVSLGWRPQYLLFRATTSVAAWDILDTARGWGAGNDALLQAQSTSGEITDSDFGAPSSTGFSLNAYVPSATGIYLAIRAPGG